MRSLKVGSVSTTIEVTGGAPVIEPSRVSTGRTISQAEVDNLPLTSRNPYNFIIFQPGVSGHPNPELGIPRTLNTNGLLDRIKYQLDGMVDTETRPLWPAPVRDFRQLCPRSAGGFEQFRAGIRPARPAIFTTPSPTPARNQFHGEFYFIGRPPDGVARTDSVALQQGQLEHRSARLFDERRRTD